MSRPCCGAARHRDRQVSGRIIEVWNKIDLLPPGRRAAGGADDGRAGPPRDHADLGVDGQRASRLLLQLIEDRLNKGTSAGIHQSTSPAPTSPRLQRLYELGEVMSRDDDAETAHDACRVCCVSPAQRVPRFGRAEAH